MDGDHSSPAPWRHWADNTARAHAGSHQAGLGRDPPAPQHGYPGVCQRSDTGGGGYPHAGSGPLPGSAGRHPAAPRCHDRPGPDPEGRLPGQRVRTRPKRRRAEPAVGLRARADPDLADDRPLGRPFAGHQAAPSKSRLLAGEKADAGNHASRAFPCAPTLERHARRPAAADGETGPATPPRAHRHRAPPSKAFRRTRRLYLTCHSSLWPPRATDIGHAGRNRLRTVLPHPGRSAAGDDSIIPAALQHLGADDAGGVTPHEGPWKVLSPPVPAMLRPGSGRLGDPDACNFGREGKSVVRGHRRCAGTG